MTGALIPDHASQAGECDGTSTVATRGSLAAKSSRGLVEEGAVMARDCVRSAFRRYTYARDQRGRRRPGYATEHLRIGGIGARESAPHVVNRNARVESGSAGSRSTRAVIVDLAEDATRRVERSTALRYHPSL